MTAATAHPEVTFVPDADNARAFRDALGRFATGVTVVTVDTLEGPMGFTANSFSSVSLDPPLVLWSPARASSRYPYYAAAAHFTIHVLGAEQDDLSRRFSRGGAGFDGLARETTPEGVPVIPGTLAARSLRTAPGPANLPETRRDSGASDGAATIVLAGKNACPARVAGNF